MRVVDTSAWIEWLDDSAVADELRTHFPAVQDCVVPTIVQLELGKWATREAGEAGARKVLALTTRCNVVALDSDIAFAAARIGMQHKLATADAIIYATAFAVGADLLTCDSHFESLEGVIYVPRRPV